jgi:hypothetical protein
VKWITALDLEQWADRVGARVAFPEMIRDLIIASANDISEVRFPGGDKGQVRGFDGRLDAVGATPYVPSGLSIWEFGVSASPATKFKTDYAKRIKEIPAAERKTLTFVFATPRTWDNPTEKLPDWLKAQREKNDFADVKYYDGVQLEDWLQSCGAVGAKHARDVLGRVPQTGARSTDEFWDEYARRYRPMLTEDVVLSARGAQAGQIVAHLLGKPGSLVFVADGPDEVSAVAVAAIRKAPEDSRKFLEARTLIVDTEEAGRGLGVADRYGFVVSPAANKISGFLAGFGPSVSGLGFKAAGQNYARLERPSTREMAEALLTTGITEEEATLLATKSGRSLTILERHAPAASFDPPIWASEGSKLIPALLAGGWDSRHDGDTAILAELGGVEYLQIEAALRGFLNRHDSPLDREGGIWKLRAPVDAFVNLSNLLGAEHLALLAVVATKVFSEGLVPEIVEERFNVSKAPYSSRLRDGLATTLLMLAVLHEEAELDVGQNPARFVETLVGSLPGLSDDYRMILSLERQLPALMEAAPDPLLLALERMLEGEHAASAPIFVETSSLGAPRSRLPNLLWALEMLAWDPRYLLRVSMVLARLAEIDPGGRSGNRPIASLRDIFLAWAPGTNAPLAVRLEVLDAVVAEVPKAGWPLLVQLLPKMHDTKGPTQRPRFREAGASEKEVLTHGIVGETYDAITDRVLGLVNAEPERWLAVLESFPRFSPDRRVQFLDMLTVYAANVTGEVKADLRRALRRLADRHARFREANWVLPDGDLNRLTALVASLESADPIDQARGLFDEWTPFGAADYIEAEKQITERRRQTVAQLAASHGATAVLTLASHVRLPQLVATAVAESSVDEALLIELLEAAPADTKSEEFAIALAGGLRWKRGETFDAQFMEIARERGWSNSRIAVLLLGWPEVSATWDLVDALGADAKMLFWTRRSPRRYEGPADQLVTLVTHFLTVGRPGHALEAIHGCEDNLDWPTIATLLGMRVQQINEGGLSGELDDYYIEELFKKLRKRTDVPRRDLAQWEYSYFPILEYRDQDLVLFDLMASDPEFFVSILSDVFVEDGTDPDEQETSAEQRARGSASYRILIAFDRMPGQVDGVVDGTALDLWVDGMVAAAEKARRLGIVGSYIGRALAHSAERDGVWPQPEVTAVLERLKSADVENGLMIERFNMRGVFTKAMFEGGQQERDFAQQYRDWAAHIPATNRRTRTLLETIAKRWDIDAEQADDEAARDRLRFE